MCDSSLRRDGGTVVKVQSACTHAQALAVRHSDPAALRQCYRPQEEPICRAERIGDTTLFRSRVNLRPSFRADASFKHCSGPATARRGMARRRIASEAGKNGRRGRLQWQRAISAATTRQRTAKIRTDFIHSRSGVLARTAPPSHALLRRECSAATPTRTSS